MPDDILPEVAQHRVFAYPIHPLLKNRWSPRSMTGEALSDEELNTLFEAARWSPSSYNEQPWRFLYAKREMAYWQRFLDLLYPLNQRWAEKAAVLVVVLSKTTRQGVLARTHSFDAGAAWMGLALQGSVMGYVVHGMAGFDADRARSSLGVPEGYAVEAMIAIGRRAPKEQLPPELQEREQPSDRRPIGDFCCEGPFSRLPASSQ